MQPIALFTFDNLKKFQSQGKKRSNAVFRRLLKILLHFYTCWQHAIARTINCDWFLLHRIMLCNKLCLIIRLIIPPFSPLLYGWGLNLGARFDIGRALTQCQTAKRSCFQVLKIRGSKIHVSFLRPSSSHKASRIFQNWFSGKQHVDSLQGEHVNFHKVHWKLEKLG